MLLMGDLVKPLKPTKQDLHFVYTECRHPHGTDFTRDNMPVLMPVLSEWAELAKAAAIAAEMDGALDAAAAEEARRFRDRLDGVREKSSACAIL